MNKGMWKNLCFRNRQSFYSSFILKPHERQCKSIEIEKSKLKLKEEVINLMKEVHSE